MARRAATHHGTRRLGIVLALLAATAGCAQEGGPDEAAVARSGPPPVSAVPAMLSVKSLVLPVEPYLFTDRQVAELFRARSLLTASCMERHGHPWPGPGAPAPDTGTLNPANTAHRYGLTDADAASRRGYHPAPGTEQPAAPKPSDRQPSPAELLLLTGLEADGTPARTDERGRRIPVGGCQGEATAALSGDPQKIGNGELVRDINLGSYERSRGDARVVKVFRAWSACMKRYGYDYAVPTRAPGKDPAFAGPSASAAEIALAGKDIACKRETNVVGVWSTVDAAYQRREIAAKPDELATVKKDIHRQVTTADRVLAGH